MNEIMICPITHNIMVNPVIASDGHTYERAAILEWIRINNTSPLTREILKDELVPNTNLQKIINEYCVKNNIILLDETEPADRVVEINDNIVFGHSGEVVFEPDVIPNNCPKTCSAIVIISILLFFAIVAPVLNLVISNGINTMYCYNKVNNTNITVENDTLYDIKKLINLASVSNMIIFIMPYVIPVIYLILCKSRNPNYASLMCMIFCVLCVYQFIVNIVCACLLVIKNNVCSDLYGKDYERMFDKYNNLYNFVNASLILSATFAIFFNVAVMCSGCK